MPRMLENTHQSRMHRSNSSSDLRADIEAAVAAGIATAGPSRGGSAKQNPTGRARHQTLAYGVSASDLNLRNTEPLQVAGFSSTLLRNGSDNIELLRVDHLFSQMLHIFPMGEKMIIFQLVYFFLSFCKFTNFFPFLLFLTS